METNSRKRIRCKVNGKPEIGGWMVSSPPLWELFCQDLSERFGKRRGGERAFSFVRSFTQDGFEFDDLSVLDDLDLVYLSEGENFIPVLQQEAPSSSTTTLSSAQSLGQTNPDFTERRRRRAAADLPEKNSPKGNQTFSSSPSERTNSLTREGPFSGTSVSPPLSMGGFSFVKEMPFLEGHKVIGQGKEEEREKGLGGTQGLFFSHLDFSSPIDQTSSGKQDNKVFISHDARGLIRMKGRWDQFDLSPASFDHQYCKMIEDASGNQDCAGKFPSFSGAPSSSSSFSFLIPPKCFDGEWKIHFSFPIESSPFLPNSIEIDVRHNSGIENVSLETKERTTHTSPLPLEINRKDLIKKSKWGWHEIGTYSFGGNPSANSVIIKEQTVRDDMILPAHAILLTKKV